MASDTLLDGDRRCPCRSGRKYKRCCRPWHQGRPAPSPEALMRSRFAAYALGLVDYIVATTDRDGPMWQADTDAWRQEIQDFCTRTSFRDLQVMAAEGDVVEFRCVLVVGAEQAEVGERSLFTRDEAAVWRYHSGEQR